jgi:hypothetical protein
VRNAWLLLLVCVLGACASEQPRHAGRGDVENAVRHAELQKDRAGAPSATALAGAER